MFINFKNLNLIFKLFSHFLHYKIYIKIIYNLLLNTIKTKLMNFLLGTN